MVWSPPSYSFHSVQSIHALTPSRIGDPDGAARQGTPANLSAPERANPALSSWWSSASTFTQNAPAARIRGQVVEVRDGAKVISGGSRESDAKLWQVNPAGPSSPIAVTTTTPETKWPRTSRMTAGETGPGGALPVMDPP